MEAVEWVTSRVCALSGFPTTLSVHSFFVWGLCWTEGVQVEQPLNPQKVYGLVGLGLHKVLQLNS